MQNVLKIHGCNVHVDGVNNEGFVLHGDFCFICLIVLCVARLQWSTVVVVRTLSALALQQNLFCLSCLLCVVIVRGIRWISCYGDQHTDSYRL